MSLWMILLACGGGPEADRQAYLRAANGPIADADAECLTIEGELGEDCHLLVAERRLATGEPASTVCAIGAMSDECWFTYAEVAELGPEKASVSCMRAGDLQETCKDNALERGVRKRVLEGELDSKLVLEIRALIDEYGTTDDEPGAMARGLIARFLPERWGDVSFSPALCGDLSERICAEAYARSQPEDPGLQERVCKTPLDLVNVARAGGRGWTPEGEPLALAVWHQLCQGEAPPPQPMGPTPQLPGPGPAPMGPGPGPGMPPGPPQ